MNGGARGDEAGSSSALNCPWLHVTLVLDVSTGQMLVETEQLNKRAWYRYIEDQYVDLDLDFLFDWFPVRKRTGNESRSELNFHRLFYCDCRLSCFTAEPNITTQRWITNVDHHFTTHTHTQLFVPIWREKKKTKKHSSAVSAASPDTMSFFSGVQTCGTDDCVPTDD